MYSNIPLAWQCIYDTGFLPYVFTFLRFMDSFYARHRSL
ncbi:hypothetical protein ETAE_1178 [Edwardsiella piscicida]|uniref:Uncharacterized protein n=1 Tax=Edwardsiella piscicida TaxID=1263550 RepID=A0AAU8P4I2_EDWPI|nr:hypothetical protein ETAE_1178 [Edwardsiella tarda EIB202]